MLEIIKALIFGIVEGISEWLPISSTGHMILLNEISPLLVSKEYLDMFLVVIQLGAIMAVVLLFWKKIFPFSFHEKGFIQKDIFLMWFKIVTACIPAVFVELFWGDKIEALFYNYKVVAFMLILVGALFIVVEQWNKNRISKVNTIQEITYQTAFYIGIFQVVAAVFPGTSRSGATIIGALLLGVSRSVITEFTFYLAIPAMFGASFMKLLDFGFHFQKNELLILLAAMVTAFLVSILVIQFLLSYIKKHDFKAFGWYRIVLGIFVFIYFGFTS
ncbi:undecaprenyl-diphosphatase [Lachnotalea glycerini]|uniref:Undecaprenyl-diphosphatase n=1 Tax=Lachnotalea glycerini TaxID=1763509 RepID=A0A318EN79_9FIRM|nr:undecaprenyl-diphosphate phosphatase [Lachnotalea glycerini]PXV91573.1 undecaprenyl-diphosphatase [Lachnotalea glycerini]